MRTTSDKTLDTRRAIVRYVGNNPGCTADQVSKALGISPTALNHHRTHLAGIGVLEYCRKGRQGGSAAWHLCESLTKPATAAKTAQAAASVNIKPDTRWTLPAPEITTLPDGVVVTRQAAPRGRFEVDLPPTGGVISHDNYRLTIALRQRAEQV
jgi:hypothetical protein